MNPQLALARKVCYFVGVKLDEIGEREMGKDLW